MNPAVEMYFQKLNRKLIKNCFPLSSAIKKMKHHKRAEGREPHIYKGTNELNESKNQQPSAQRTEKKKHDFPPLTGHLQDPEGRSCFT